MRTSVVKKLRSKHLKLVTLNCCEYHAHSNKCLGGPEDSLSIIKLADELLFLRKRLAQFAAKENEK